ncbi:hypothetical protein D0862_10816 [Hortaea werneckii]|uniref:Uncharacterized protein n=1 Tax=Hortaea werneckii TaxID=91943 RepID=A0A3M7FEA5_HORWE|nr:hypothetical protein D0862_10816 [Hortaea werneckii]
MVSSEECDRLLASGAKIKPDADISGIGVILAFLITAYASFVAILAAYVCGMVEPESLSLADVKVMRIRSRTERHPRMHRILRQTIIVLSDQQIVTGIAIMTAGFVGLRSGQISVYHYQIVLYLAWLSSSVHLSALTLLRPFLNRHSGLKVWRLVGMGALFIMLIIGLVPTVSYDWGIINFKDPKDSSIGKNDLTGWGVPASCFWSKTYADGPIGTILEQAWVSHESAGTEDTKLRPTAEKGDNSRVQGCEHATLVHNASPEEPERCRAYPPVLLQILGSPNASNLVFPDTREDALRIVKSRT